MATSDRVYEVAGDGWVQAVGRGPKQEVGRLFLAAQDGLVAHVSPGYGAEDSYLRVQRRSGIAVEVPLALPIAEALMAVTKQDFRNVLRLDSGFTAQVVWAENVHTTVLQGSYRGKALSPIVVPLEDAAGWRLFRDHQTFRERTWKQVFDVTDDRGLGGEVDAYIRPDGLFLARFSVDDADPEPQATWLGDEVTSVDRFSEISLARAGEVLDFREVGALRLLA